MAVGWLVGGGVLPEAAGAEVGWGADVEVALGTEVTAGALHAASTSGKHICKNVRRLMEFML
jgi:hypothetical protein